MWTIDDELDVRFYFADAPSRAGGLRSNLGAQLEVLHTPGHSHGAVCFHLAGQGWLFSGDTLFAGGPGATGRSFSDFGTIISSIRGRLLGVTRRRVVYGKASPADEALLLELRRRYKGEVVALSEYLDRDLVALWGYDDLS